VIGNCESKISKNEFKSQEKKQETINSYTAHFEKADSFRLREKIFEIRFVREKQEYELYFNI